MNKHFGSVPHGGTLINRALRGELRAAMQARAATLPRLALSRMALCDLELIANGAYSPLTGFMGPEDYERVLTEMRLTSGLVWSVPITLPVDTAYAVGETIALCEDERVLAVMDVSACYRYDKQREAELVYRTTDEKHPGVARLYAQGEWLLGGDIWLIDEPSAASTEFPQARLSPAQIRAIFHERGWRRMVGFQTRNPIHRAHEYIQKTALEVVDGLLLHPLVGETKGDDIPADVRMESYEELVNHYYPLSRVILAVYPAAMRYAGPREAILHALSRKNYSCTHFIVGRDHAGVGNYYGTYDAQLIFDEFRPEELGITPLFFEHTFYCKTCLGIVSSKTCPHDKTHHIALSGTQVRQMLERGEELPVEFTRPQVSHILIKGMQAKRATEAA